MPDAYWEHFHHEADVGVRGVAPTLEGAFEQAALAMTAVITDPAGVKAATAVVFSLQETDPDYLLVDWLNRLIYEMSTRRTLFSRFAVRLLGDQLQATAWGEPVDVARHQPAVEVKGATFTELAVRQDSQGRWVAQCVIDV